MQDQTRHWLDAHFPHLFREVGPAGGWHEGPSCNHGVTDMCCGAGVLWQSLGPGWRVTTKVRHLPVSSNNSESLLHCGSLVLKAWRCREVGASVLIDDNPVYACDCAEAGMEVVLFDWHLDYAWSKLPDGGCAVHQSRAGSCS